MILFWMEYTFQIQRSLLKNWIYVKFIQIMIITNNDIEKILESLLSMLSFEKLVRDEQQKVNDDEENHFKACELYK